MHKRSRACTHTHTLSLRPSPTPTSPAIASWCQVLNQTRSGEHKVKLLAVAVLWGEEIVQTDTLNAGGFGDLGEA